MKCEHKDTKQVGPDRGFFDSVAVPPYTEENPAAHGGITYRVACVACGAERAVNVNGNHAEYSPWSPSKAAREEYERRGALARELERYEAVKRGAPSVEVDGRSYIVDRVDRKEVVLRHEPGGERRGMSWDVLREAAEQQDDALRAIYSAIERDARLVQRHQPCRPSSD